MANVIAVQSILSKTVLATLRNQCHFPMLAYKPFDADFNQEINGYNVGNTVRYRKPTYTNFRIGTVAQPQSLIEVEDSIVLDKPIGADWNPNLLQLTTDMDSQVQIAKRFVEPACMKIANEIDKSFVQALMAQVYNVSGTAGATVNSWATFDLAKTKLVQLGVPEPYNAVLNPLDRHYLQSSMVNFFNTSFNEEIGVKGVLGETDGVMSYMDQNLLQHTNGTFAAGGAVTVTTTMTSGSTTMVLGGFTPNAVGVLNAGDIINVSGTHSLNIMSQQAIGTDTSALQGFIVPQAYNADGSGNVTITVSPAPIQSGSANPYNNVDVLPTSGATVTVYGGANATYTNNFMFYRDGIMMIMKPYFKPYVPAGAYGSARDDKTGLVFSTIQWFDGNQFNNLIRLDGLYGIKIDPRYIVRLIG